VAVLAGVYAFTAKPSWLASQTLILRNEAANNEVGPGKFNRSEELKSAEETILELAKSQGVLRASLAEVGPCADWDHAEAWPSDRDVDALRRVVTIVPPKGTEFGTAEVFHLEVRDAQRERAVRLASAICDRLAGSFQNLRDEQAQSMVAELTKTVRLAKADLNETTARLTGIEKSLGDDLPELRGMHDAASGDSPLRRSAAEIAADLRHAHAAEQANRQLLEMARAALDDPGRLLAVPSRVLDTQPALRRLKDGLADAQLNTARLEGNMAAEHPLVIAAKEAEREVAGHLRQELKVVAGSLEAELRLDDRRITLLTAQLDAVNHRLGRLAELRADYANLVAETGQRSKLVERAEQNMAEARAARASAKAASLISRIDAPDPGIRPTSPSPLVILLGGLLGALATGVGVVLLTAPAGADRTPHAPREGAACATGAASAEARRTVAEPVAPNGHVATPAAGKLSIRQALEKAWNGHNK
jgi:uncharacterized protein involved in exopolysaccharide biosynthesis